jgi:NTP pyrophosphatase (non-canonical NTP hydrolase)
MRTLANTIKNLLTVSLAIALCLGGLIFLNPSAGIAATVEETMTRAANDFLHSALQDYRETTEASFSTAWKMLQKNVNELSEQWETVADPQATAEVRQQARQKITDSQKALEDVAQSFTGLAQETEEFHGQLDRALQTLVDRVQGQIHQQLTGSQESFTRITQAISTIAEDTNQVTTEEVGDLLTQVGDHINALSRALDAANQAIKAFAG